MELTQINLKNINKNIKLIPEKGELPDTDLSKKLMVETIKHSDFTNKYNCHD